MNRIAEEVEHDDIYWSIITAQRTPPEATGSDAIAAAAHQITDTLGLKAITAWTFSGATAFRIARERPNSTVLALTPRAAPILRVLQCVAASGVDCVVISTNFTTSTFTGGAPRGRSCSMPCSPDSR